MQKFIKLSMLLSLGTCLMIQPGQAKYTIHCPQASSIEKGKIIRKNGKLDVWSISGTGSIEGDHPQGLSTVTMTGETTYTDFQDFNFSDAHAMYPMDKGICLYKTKTQGGLDISFPLPKGCHTSKNGKPFGYFDCE